MTSKAYVFTNIDFGHENIKLCRTISVSHFNKKFKYYETIYIILAPWRVPRLIQVGLASPPSGREGRVGACVCKNRLGVASSPPYCRILLPPQAVPRLAEARSRSGSDTPPACHSLPSRRFATSQREADKAAPAQVYYEGSRGAEIVRDKAHREAEVMA